MKKVMTTILVLVSIVTACDFNSNSTGKTDVRNSTIFLSLKDSNDNYLFDPEYSYGYTESDIKLYYLNKDSVLEEVYEPQYDIPKRFSIEQSVSDNGAYSLFIDLSTVVWDQYSYTFLQLGNDMDTISATWHMENGDAKYFIKIYFNGAEISGNDNDEFVIVK